MISTLSGTFHIISQQTLIHHVLSMNLLLSDLFLLSQEPCFFPHLSDLLLHIGCKGFKVRKWHSLNVLLEWLQSLTSDSHDAFLSLVHYIGASQLPNNSFCLSH